MEISLVDCTRPALTRAGNSVSVSSCSSICIRPINLCKEKHCRTNAPAQAVCLRVRSVWRGEHASSTGKIRRSGISKSNDNATIQTTGGSIVRYATIQIDWKSAANFRARWSCCPPVTPLSSPTFLNLYRQILSRRAAGTNLPDERNGGERKTRKLGNAAGVSGTVRMK